MDFYFVGFFPKKRVTRSNWLSLRDENTENNFPGPEPVLQLCSVSDCIVDGIEVFDYQEISMASFNQYGGFNQLNSALEIMAKDGENEFDLYAYSLPEAIFRDGHMEPNEIGCVEPDEVSDDSPDFMEIGYDIVEIRDCSFFCSPLTCNWQANMNKSIVNQYCLVEHEADAIKLATEFSVTKPEPGPYIIVKIWKYNGPNEIHLR